MLWETSARNKFENNKGKVMTKPHSFIGPRQSTKEDKGGIIAIVDPFSTGATLSVAVADAGYKCVRVLSDWDNPIASMIDSTLKNLEFYATVQYDNRNPDADKAVSEVRWHTTGPSKGLDYPETEHAS
jgi:hypothetical protein